MAIDHDPAAAMTRAVVSRLKLRQLLLLQQIDRHRALNRVAAHMGLSQPAVTQALREVEDIFGARLFERTGRGLKATPAGDAVLLYAGRWLTDLESTTRVLTALEAGHGGRLRLGFTSHMPQTLLSTALTHLLRGPSRLAVMTREGTTDELVAALLARELDCAIGRSYEGDDPDIVQEVLHHQEPCLVVSSPSAARLAGKPLDWAALAQLDWIMLPPNTPMRRMLSAIFVGAGVQPPTPLLETTSLRSIETVLRSEPNAITVLARDVVDELVQGGHCAVLPHRLPWDLPPVSFFTTRQLAEHRPVLSLRAALVQSAAAIRRPRAGAAQGRQA